MRITVRHLSEGFDAGPEDTLLEAGRRAGFGFPHACRNGNCLRCQGTLLHGKVRQRIGNLASAEQHLCATPESPCQVLYCVAYALSDCEIDVPDVTAPGQLPVFEVACQVHAIDPLSPDVSRVLLRLPAGRKVRWYAGQYLLLQVPGGSLSAFSIANPAPARMLELHVRHPAGQASTDHLMAALAEHATVQVTLPQGTRHLGEHPSTRPQWFICGSTGFAPVKAMIEQLLTLPSPPPIRLYWGARQQPDLYLESLARHWAAEHGIALVLALSDLPQAGYVHGLVQEPVLADLPHHAWGEFHVAGSPPMAWAVHDALAAAGVPRADIHSDVFDYAPRD
ncbi:2Fe-2S iron-sulfur cluster-binding protein [Isoalcanivorax beigongshangi]|uniref:2Fe-2S iron-sulfur cluster-binding protein n=1 Tax=Isoalcanivorax beigongshangi TaxID=3238810 RepID=A0ABV4AGR4_9GAMM